MITVAAPGSELQDTSTFRAAKEAGKDQCDQLVKEAVSLAVAAAKSASDDFGLNHGDLIPGNVFFDDCVTKATLIDWGKAREKPVRVFVD